MESVIRLGEYSFSFFIYLGSNGVEDGVFVWGMEDGAVYRGGVIVV